MRESPDWRLPAQSKPSSATEFEMQVPIPDQYQIGLE